MKKLTLLLITLITINLVTLQSQTYLPDYQDGKIYFKLKNAVENNIVVNTDRSVDLEQVELLKELRQAYDLTSMSRPYDINNDELLLRTYLLEFENFNKIEEIIASLEEYPEIEYAEKVPYTTIIYTPDDPLYNLINGPSDWNWHLDLINAEEAWDITKGSEEVKVAVVDNAVWVDHPDLADKIVLERDTYYNDNDANPPGTGDLDAWSHGTHVSGLVAAATDNETGVASIGYNVSLIAVKSSNNNNPNGVYGYPGIQWAANNGADIINMSWGGSGYSQSEQNIITAIHNMGVTMFAAAGNNNSSSPHYPSNYDHVISIASIDYDDTKSSFSNYNFGVDLSAPGGFCSPGPSGVLSTYYNETSMGYYDYIYGTSMASPVAAGLGALVLSINTDLTPDELEDILKENAFDIDPVNPDYAGKLGAGRIDAYASVMNTPFEPTSDFSTPVTIITPGSPIDFTNHATGIPDDYEWYFEGGTPSTTSQANPEDIRFLNEGIYDVSLTVSNDFGTDEKLITDYITVTNTPVPFINFSVSDTNSCIMTPVSFMDMSLYEPTEWLWEFEPNSVNFVEGTTANSQNPFVEFQAPGYYTVTLTATNENGSNTDTKTDFVYAQGIDLPFTEDFESGSSMDFTLSANENAHVAIDHRAAKEDSEYGLHFHGNTEFGGWAGSPTNTTPEEAWVDNIDFTAKAMNCKVDATGVSALALSLDLRQTFSLGTKTSWFRVLVNDEPVNDFNGDVNFNPETNEDPFETKIFDLSDFADSYFSLTLQSSCYLYDRFFEEGDNVFVDNISVYNFVDIAESSSDRPESIVYPVPANDHFNVSLSGARGKIVISLFDATGQMVYSESLSAKSKILQKKINIDKLKNGVYLLRIKSENGLINKKIIKQK